MYCCPVPLATKTHRISCREPRTSPTLGPVLHVSPPARKGCRACAATDATRTIINAYTIADMRMLDIEPPANKPRHPIAGLYWQMAAKPNVRRRCHSQSIRVAVYVLVP